MAKADLDLFNEFWLRTEREDQFRHHLPNMRRARPFALSDEIDEMVASLALRADDLRSRRHLASARLPYPVMWIEHGDAGFGRRLPPGVETMFGTPERTGWLLVQDPSVTDGKVWTATRISRVVNMNSGELLASVYPLVHYVSTDATFDYAAQTLPANAFAPGANRDLRDAYDMVLTMHRESHSTCMIGWGGGDRALDSNDAQVQESLLRDSPLYGHAAVRLEEQFLHRIVRENSDPRGGVLSMMQKAALDHVSELRYLVAALALLNEVPVEFVPYRPSGTARVGGRLRPFMSSSLVSITVPQSRRRLKDIDRLLQQRGREAAKKARHEVRGHFRHVKKLPKAHPERWERWQMDDGSWVWRTFIAHHLRGSAELGWVEQRYQMVPKHQTDRSDHHPEQ